MNFRHLVSVSIFILGLLAPVFIYAQTSVLFVGNSYTYYNEMPEMFEHMARFNGVDCKIDVSVNGGVSLKDHWEGHAGLNTKPMIKADSFDFVVVQDQSLTPILNPKQTRYFGKKISNLVKQQGGEMIIFQSWSRKNNPNSQMQLDRTFQQLSKEAESAIAPIAKAWHLAIKTYPELELYDADGSHPSIVGSYLTAMIIFKTLFDTEDPSMASIFKSDKLTDSQIQKCLSVADLVINEWQVR